MLNHRPPQHRLIKHNATYLIVTVLSAFPLDFSTSTYAPETSRMALILHPPFPIRRDITFPGTVSFLDLRVHQELFESTCHL